MDFNIFPADQCIDATSLSVSYPEMKRYLGVTGLKKIGNAKSTLSISVSRENWQNWKIWLDTVYVNRIDFLIKLPFFGLYTDYRAVLTGNIKETYTPYGENEYTFDIEILDGEITSAAEPSMIIATTSKMITTGYLPVSGGKARLPYFVFGDIVHDMAFVFASVGSMIAEKMVKPTVSGLDLIVGDDLDGKYVIVSYQAVI